MRRARPPARPSMKKSFISARTARRSPTSRGEPVVAGLVGSYTWGSRCHDALHTNPSRTADGNIDGIRTISNVPDRLDDGTGRVRHLSRAIEGRAGEEPISADG